MSSALLESVTDHFAELNDSRHATAIQRAQCFGGNNQRTRCTVLERQRWLARDEQSAHLTLPLEEGDEDTLQQLQGYSIT